MGVGVVYTVARIAARFGGGRSIVVSDGRHSRIHWWQPLHARCGWWQQDETVKPCPIPLEGLFEFIATEDAAPAALDAALRRWHEPWRAPFPVPASIWAETEDDLPTHAETKASVDAILPADQPGMPLFDFMVDRAHPDAKRSRRPAPPPPPPEPLEAQDARLRETVSDLVLCAWVCLAADPMRPMAGLPFTEGLAAVAMDQLRKRSAIVPFEFARMSPAARLGTLGFPLSMQRHTRQVHPVFAISPDADLDLRAADRNADSARPETLAPFWSPVEASQTQNIYAVAWLDFWTALNAGLRLRACASCGQVFLGTGGRHVYCALHASSGAREPDAAPDGSKHGQEEWRARRAYEKARQRAGGTPFPDFTTWAAGYPHRAGRRQAGA